MSFALQEATDDGHCGLPVESLLTLAVKLLDVDKQIVRTALDHELAGAEVAGDTIGGEPCIFLRGLHTAVEYPFGELDALVPAYAMTIHKSQGSEYPAVVITLATQHYTMLARNLLYTAVTRGKRLVVIVGQRRALAIAVRSGAGRKRWTKLREWLAR